MELLFTKKGKTEWIWGRQSLAGAWGAFYAVCGHKCCLGSCIYDSEVKRRPLGYIKFACFWHVDGIASHKTKWNHQNDMNRGAKLWDWARDTPGQWGFGDEEPTEEKEQLLNRSKFESSILKARRRASQGWENTASTEEKGVGWIRHEGAVLVVQGLGIRLPGPRTRVRALAGDWDPTCWRAAKPVSHNSRGDWQHNRRCHVLQLRPSAAKESLEKKQRHEEIWGIDRCAHYLDCGWFYRFTCILHICCMLHICSFYITYFSISEVAQSCLTLCDPMDCPWDFPGKSTGVGCHFLLQEIFPTQGLNPGLPLQCFTIWATREVQFLNKATFKKFLVLNIHLFFFLKEGVNSCQMLLIDQVRWEFSRK